MYGYGQAIPVEREWTHPRHIDREELLQRAELVYIDLVVLQERIVVRRIELRRREHGDGATNGDGGGTRAVQLIAELALRGTCVDLQWGGVLLDEVHEWIELSARGKSLEEYRTDVQINHHLILHEDTRHECGVLGDGCYVQKRPQHRPWDVHLLRARVNIIHEDGVVVVALHKRIGVDDIDLEFECAGVFKL